MLLATLIGDADLIIREAQRRYPSLSVPIFESVMNDFREATSNFTDIEFVRSSRAARRRNPILFNGA